VCRVYFVSETAQVELKVDECKPLPVLYASDSFTMPNCWLL